MSTSQGWAIRRNGTCFSEEEACGPTVANFNACCPSSFSCSNPYNQVCCQRGQNCTQSLIPAPKCANSTWDLYDNGGYFCCEHGLSAFDRDGTNLCASPGFRPEGEQLLQLVKAGETSTSLSSSTSSASSTSSSSPQSSGDSSTPIGAIVGGVVGVVLGLAALGLLVWFILRRKRWANPDEIPKEQEHFMKYQLDDTQVAPDTHTIHEADDQATSYEQAQELPAKQVLVELPSTQSPP